MPGSWPPKNRSLSSTTSAAIRRCLSSKEISCCQLVTRTCAGPANGAGNWRVRCCPENQVSPFQCVQCEQNNQMRRTARFIGTHANSSNLHLIYSTQPRISFNHMVVTSLQSIGDTGTQLFLSQTICCTPEVTSRFCVRSHSSMLIACLFRSAFCQDRC